MPRIARALGTASPLALVALLFASSNAWAETTTQPTPSAQPASDDDDASSEGTSRPPVSDLRQGSWSVAASGEFVDLSGKISSNLATSSQPSSGYGLTLRGSYGVSRMTQFDMEGSYGELFDSACDPCGGKLAHGSLGFTYHVTQGLAVDPWASAALGYRFANFTDALGDSRSFHGIDWARLAVGINVFPVPRFGIGPYMGFDLGSFLGMPQGAGTASVYRVFHLGLRVSFDTAAHQAPQAGQAVRGSLAPARL